MNRLIMLVSLALLMVGFTPTEIRGASLPPDSPAGNLIFLPFIGEGTNLTANFRNGQTFLTWPESTDLQGELYRIYRSNQPITESNLHSATLLAQTGKDSARFYANRYKSTTTTQWQPRYSDRLIIADGSSPLPLGMGLLVWTLAPEDFNGGSSGEGYYAVTVTPPGGQEIFDRGNTIQIAEQVEPPTPVDITSSPGVNPGAGGHVYIQYMDLRHWNPTFHAPNWTNAYYGLDPSNPSFSHDLQYAYDYSVYTPSPGLCGGTLPVLLPVILNLHGWGGNDYPAATKNYDTYCAYMIYPIDETETWYFGFARNHDYRKPGNVIAGDVIENYTEQRILQMLLDLERNPPGPAVDTQRVYVYGESMGGSGALAFAERYPNVFAAAYASQPMTNYRTAETTHVNWVADVSIKWGGPNLNLPIILAAPEDWAYNLQKYNGVGVWDWQDYQANLTATKIKSRMADDMVPVGVAHGIPDHVLKWDTQGQPVYSAFNAGRRAWAGQVTTDDHQWEYFKGLPPSLGLRGTSGPFWGLTAVLSETVPGLSNLSGDEPLPPTVPGGYNQTIKWSSSWDAWDGAPIDEPKLWRISLCAVASGSEDCGTGLRQTVDVTPRRLQHFVVTPGAQYFWKNEKVATGTTIANGTVTADANGLITVKSFQISPAGNRLTISPVDAP